VPQTSRRALDAWLTRNRVRYADMSESQPLILELAGAAAGESRPVAPASGSAANAERRGQSRRPCRLGVNVYGPTGGVLQHCTLTDISGGGCYVETTQPLAVGTSVIIEVRTHDFKLNVRGKVQSKHPGYGMGIAFKAKTDDDHEQVRRLLAYQENPSGQLAAEAVELI
jgi:hypothetical protein